MSFYTKLTKAGLVEITTALNNGTKVPIKYMAIGDGFGETPDPDENATSLVNEVYRTQINKIDVHPKNDNWLVCEAIIPSAIGGFNIREVSLFDTTGLKMLAVANYPATYKPSLEEGAAKIQTIRIVLQVDNTGVFELIIDPDIVLATTASVESVRKEAIEHADSLAENLESNLPSTFGQPAGLLGGAVRLTPEGVPYFIHDSAHQEIGFTSVEKGSTDYILKVNYDRPFAKVGALLATVDETLAPYMLSMGGSVAQKFANIQIAAPLYFTAKGDGTISAIPEIWKDYVAYSAASSSPEQGYVVFTTPAKPLTSTQPLVSAKTDTNWLSRYKNYSAYSIASAIKVGAFIELENWVRFSYKDGSFITPSYTKSDYSMIFADGILTINHPSHFVGNVAIAGRNIQAIKSNYRYVMEEATPTQTKYKVYDEANVLKTTADNIDLMFRVETPTKSRSLEPLLATDEFTIFAGYYYLPIDALKKIQSGNLWMTGIMNK